jgi:hypothetical protein
MLIKRNCIIDMKRVVPVPCNRHRKEQQQQRTHETTILHLKVASYI